MGRTKKEKKQRVPFLNRIQSRLIMTFLLPILCIIILGVVSYKRSSTVIDSNFEESLNHTMYMLDEYLGLACDTVQTTYKQYVSEKDLIRYFKGSYTTSSDSINIYKEYKTEFSGNVATDELLSNVFFLMDTENSILTTSAQDDDLYQKYMNTSQGSMLSKDKYSYFLFGNQSEVDEYMNTSADSYALRIARHLNDSKTIMLIDIKKSIIVDKLSSLDAGEGSYVGLVTCDGTEILDNGTSSNLNTIFIGTEFYEEAVNSEENIGSKYVSYKGESFLFLYDKMEGRGAMICALVPQEIILGQTSDIKKLTVLFVTIVSFAAILLGSVMAKQYDHTISGMLKKLKVISNGDLTVQVTSKRNDEFRLLANGMSDMVRKMKELIQKITQVSIELNDASQKVTGSSETFVDTAKGIQLTIGEIDRGITKLDEDSVDCLSQMDILSSKIVTVTESASDITDLNAQTKQSVNKGMYSIEELKGCMDSTIDITLKVIGSIEVLAEKSKEIGTIVNSINEMAEQTNLLSLNASIESARAGKAGKGFAVVAEEIRKLADQSLESSRQIERIVSEVLDKTMESISIARNAEEIVKEQRNVATKTTESFAEVEEQMKLFEQSLNKICNNTGSMEQARIQTLNAMESISAISTETAAASGNVYDSAEKQYQAVEALNEASTLLEARAKELEELMKNFII